MVEGKSKPAGTTPLLLPAIFWVAGISTGFFCFSQSLLPYYFSIFIPLAVVFTFGFVLYKSPSVKIILLLLFVFTLAFIRTSLSQHRPDNHILKIWEEKSRIVQPITLKITSPFQMRKHAYGNRYQVTGDIKEIAGEQVAGKIILTFPVNYLVGEEENLIRGNHLQTTARMSKNEWTAGFSRIPDAYFRSNNTADIIGFAVTTVKVVDHSTYRQNLIGWISDNYHRRIHNARSFLLNRIEDRVPSHHSPFIKAILLGDRSGMQEERETLARAGMAHLLAISGLHLSIITLVIITLLSLFYIRRTLAHVTTILIIIFYAEICGWTPSISRAAVMITLYLLTKILQRKPSPNNILLASLILITAINPAQIFSIGLQFSFISVFVIINVYPIFKRWRDSSTNYSERNFLLRWSKIVLKNSFDVVLLSFFISIFLAPLMLYYFNQFSLNGIIANIVGIPLLSLVIPLSLLVIVFPNITAIIDVYQAALSFILDLMNDWTNLTASLPLFFNFIPFSLVQTVAVYSLMILLLLKAKKYLDAKNEKAPIVIGKTTKRKNIGRSNRRYPIEITAMLTLLIIVVYPYLFTNTTNLLKITMFDVGHGDLFLIETPASENILIDTGPRESERGHIRNSAASYLRQRGMKRLDWVMITHGHDDHYGGLKWIMDNMEVKNIIITENFQQSPVWNNLLTDKRCSNTIIIADTTRIENLSLTNKIIHPDKDYYSDEENNMSLVMRIEYNNFSILFTGDIEADAEMYLLRKYPAYLQSLVLKVPHHGSNTSSGNLFLETVAASYALIPAPAKGNPNFPHKDTLKRLSYMPPQNLFISGEDGNVRIKTDGFTATVEKLNQRKKTVINF